MLIIMMPTVVVQGQETEAAPEPKVPQETQWYTHLNGQTQGPFSQSKMEEMVANGMITHTTSVNRAGDDGWVEAQTVFTFKAPPPAVLPARTGNKMTVAEKRAADPNYDNRMAFLNSRRTSARVGLLMNIIGLAFIPVGMGVMIATESDGLGAGLVFGAEALRVSGFIVANVARKRVENEFAQSENKIRYRNRALTIMAPIFALSGFGLMAWATANDDTPEGGHTAKDVGGLGVALYIIGEVQMLISAASSARYIKKVQREERGVTTSLAPFYHPTLGAGGLQLHMTF